MNSRIRELAEQANAHETSFAYYRGEKKPENAVTLHSVDLEKFAELLIRECNQAVLEVPLYYKDYRSQIEEAVIHDCARAVLEKFGIK